MTKFEKPAIGERVMWEYGRRDYATYGEIGTVTAHAANGFTVRLDDEQPYHRWCYGAKTKRGGHARDAHFTTDTVRLLVDVYRENAERMRRIAADWDRAADAVAVKGPQ